MTPEDYHLIEKQLGRSPRGTLDIVVRDKKKRPVVLMTDPLLDGHPFPTLYWLVHEALHKEISQIESNAFIKYLEKNIIPWEEEIQKRLLEDTREYQKQRWEALSTYYKLEDINEQYKKQLQSVGIGGLRDFTKVKCLHMHYAHYLTGQNIIGEIMEKKFHLSRLIK